MSLTVFVDSMNGLEPKAGVTVESAISKDSDVAWPTVHSEPGLSLPSVAIVLIPVVQHRHALVMKDADGEFMCRIGIPGGQ